jgi:hypothetical protein
LRELSTVDLSFDLEATGFEAPQIDLMIASLSIGIEAAADEKPLPCVSGTPVSRAGDLWSLGRHRVLCGDATDALFRQPGRLGGSGGRVHRPTL